MVTKIKPQILARIKANLPKEPSRFWVWVKRTAENLRKFFVTVGVNIYVYMVAALPILLFISLTKYIRS